MFRKEEGKGYLRVESGRTPFWKDAAWRPFLQPTGSHTLCWPNPLTTFQNFCGTIAQCFKISFQSSEKEKIEVCVSLICAATRDGLWEASSGVTDDIKQTSLAGWNGNGTFRTSVKFQWVGAAECVCERLLAIDDLSQEAMKLAFIRADTLSPWRQPIIEECFLTVPVTLINTPYTVLYIFPNVYYLLFNSWLKQNEKFQHEAFVCC